MGQDKTVAERYTAILGSNRFRGVTGSIIRANLPNGTTQEFLQVEKDVERGGDGRLLVSFETRNRAGDLLVKIRRNKVVHVSPEFRTRESRDRIVVESSSGKIVTGLNILNDNAFEIIGEFFLGDQLLTITPGSLRLGGLEMRDCDLTNVNVGLALQQSKGAA